MKNQISKFLKSKINEGDFPSAVYLVAEEGEIKLNDALGFAVVEPEKIKATLDTIYDLASLTKVLVTGLLCVKLIDEGRLILSDKVSKYLPYMDTDDKRDITIQHLLTHTSGFRAWYPFYIESVNENPYKRLGFVHRKIVEMELENPIGSKVVYSDLNFITLGILLETFYQLTLEEITKTRLFSDSFENTFYNPPNGFLKKIAASEKGNAFEKQTCIDLGFFDTPEDADCSSLFRSEIIWGKVHDNNCYFLEGYAGHAGLFSNIYEVFKIAQQFLAESTTLLKPETCELFHTNFTPNLNQARSLAFQLAETEDSTASEALSKDSFGHLGFTGTSLWIDPSKQRIYILLTNRTHNRKLPLADLKETRQTFHRISTNILD